jgi:hypothetical protein
MDLTIHLVWIQAEKYQKGQRLIPTLIKKNYTRWKSMNANDFNITFKTYCESDVKTFIVKYYGQEMLDVYKLLETHPHTEHYRTDLFRFLLLFVEGGLYIDVDTEPVALLKDIGINPALDFMAVCCGSAPNDYRISNGFVYVKSPGSNYLLKCIEHSVRRIVEAGTDVPVDTAVGGCFIMRDAYRELFQTDPLTGTHINNGKLFQFHYYVAGKIKDQCKDLYEFWNSFCVKNLKGDVLMNDRYPTYYLDKGVNNPRLLSTFE